MSATPTPRATERAPRRKGRSPRRRARLAAIQALYQIELLGEKPERVIAEFAGRLEGVPATDFDFFRALVAGASAAREVIDGRIAATLAKGWRLERLSITMRGLLRAAAFELDRFRDIPPRVTVSEYVDLAREFFDAPEIGFVNGVVETLARALRADDWGPGERVRDGGAPG
jgi:N utilization substance protein B